LPPNPDGNHDPHYHMHHHHQQHGHGLPPLTIRRHIPGSNDPTLQRFPPNIQPTGNVSSSSKVNVSIKRHTVEPEQPVVQPVLYPVAVYVNQPIPQPPMPTVIPQIVQYPPAYQPIQYFQAIEEPPNPVVSPIKIVSPPPPPPQQQPPAPTSPTRYETESFHPPSRNKNTTPRRPVRLDNITPIPTTFEPPPRRPSKVVVEEYDDYNEEYRVPGTAIVPEQVVSYRSVPGRTTREIQNERMDDSTYVQSPSVQTVTYRVS